MINQTISHSLLPLGVDGSTVAGWEHGRHRPTVPPVRITVADQFPVRALYGRVTSGPRQDRSIAPPLRVGLTHWCRLPENVLDSCKSAFKNNGSNQHVLRREVGELNHLLNRGGRGVQRPVDSL